MAFYYNGRGRNKTLVLKKVVGTEEEILNGSTGTYDDIPDDITKAFTAVDGTEHPLIDTDDAFAKLSTEAYMRRLADFVVLVKSMLATEGETAFANLNLTVGAEVMTGATGPVPAPGN
jgi:hypothetical protein